MAWRVNWELETLTYTLLHIKQVTSKGLLGSTGNSTWYFVITYGVKNLKKNVCVRVCVCVKQNYFAVQPETNTALCNTLYNYTPRKF